MVLRTGKRRNLVAIQKATRTADGQGGFTSAWTTEVNEWSRAVPLSESRTLDQGGVKYSMAVEFTIRKRPSFELTTEHSILWNGTHYTIHSVVPSEKLDDMRIIAYV